MYFRFYFYSRCSSLIGFIKNNKKSENVKRFDGEKSLKRKTPPVLAKEQNGVLFAKSLSRGKEAKSNLIAFEKINQALRSLFA
jgi:hypothetical protein